MRKRLSVWLLVGVMYIYITGACSSGENVNNEPNVKLETTETTVGDVIGQDSEIQMTTVPPEESGSDNEAASNEKDTSDSSASQNGSTSQSTSDTGEATTTQAQTTSSQPTTTQKQTTTQKVTTTQAQTTTIKTTATSELETIGQETTTNAAMTGSDRGAVTLDIEPSVAAKNRASKIVADIITDSMSDYQCVKAIHDYLVKNTDYGFVGISDAAGTDLAHKAEGALCYDTAVCQGYAEAFELLCAEVGIQAYMMYGTAGTAATGYESHAWNVVRVNGEWYQIDCTWDDPLINGNIVTDGSNITYKYFLLTDTEMYVDHVLDKTYSKNAKVCTSTLFKGVGERLSLEAALGEPSKIVLNAKAFYEVVEYYVSSKVLDFYIAIPATETISMDSIGSAATAGLTKAGLTGQYSIGYVTKNVVSYVVYHITISK